LSYLSDLISSSGGKDYHHAFVQAGLDPVEAVRWQGKRERMVGVRPR